MILVFWLYLFISYIATALAQSQVPTLGLQDGFLTFDTPSFTIQLVKDSQTLASLKPKGSAAQTNNGTFDFSPLDRLVDRQYNGNYQLGDVTFRVRQAGTQNDWINGDSSVSRNTVAFQATSGSTLAAADLSMTLPNSSLINIVRKWSLNDDALVMEFEVSNPQTFPVEIGSMGFPVVFNTIFTGRTAADTNVNCSLIDPYIGKDAGFVQVAPLLGTQPPLVITPSAKTPFEAWRFLPENTVNYPYYQSQTFEGYYEWQTHTLAWAENEWKNVTPWNTPTSGVLDPGQTRVYGLEFHLGTTIQEIDNTLEEIGRPITTGIPGYIVPADQTAKLFVKHTSKIQNVSVDPPGILDIKTNSEGKNGYVGYTLTVPSSQGLPARARIMINYEDSISQTVHYFLTQPSTQTISNLGDFLINTQWFENSTDPFGRSPSVLSYDRQVNAHVINDDRAW